MVLQTRYSRSSLELTYAYKEPMEKLAALAIIRVVVLWYPCSTKSLTVESMIFRRLSLTRSGFLIWVGTSLSATGACIFLILPKPSLLSHLWPASGPGLNERSVMVFFCIYSISCQEFIKGTHLNFYLFPSKTGKNPLKNI